MVKCETIGMIEISKGNPVIKLDVDVVNNSFITYNDDLYLVSNTISGDDAYMEDAVIKAGDFINGYLVKAWEGQKLVVDGKHITGGVSALKEGDTLVAGDDGLLAAGSATGVHFVVTDKTTLTEAAVKVKVVVA